LVKRDFSAQGWPGITVAGPKPPLIAEASLKNNPGCAEQQPGLTAVNRQQDCTGQQVYGRRKSLPAY
jgi:hypothetical protein